MVLASRSKSRQKIEESSKSLKNLKNLKSCKGHHFGGTFTEALILRQRTQTFNRLLTVFRALFARSKNFFDITFRIIIVMARPAEPLILCHFFSPEEPRRGKSPRTFWAPFV